MCSLVNTHSEINQVLKNKLLLMASVDKASLTLDSIAWIDSMTVDGYAFTDINYV